jgi:hypothetical protein
LEEHTAPIFSPEDIAYSQNTWQNHPEDLHIHIVVKNSDPTRDYIWSNLGTVGGQETGMKVTRKTL